MLLVSNNKSLMSLYLLIAIVALGCDRKNNRIGQMVAITPDGKKIAMAIGPYIRKYPHIENIKACAAILDMNLPSNVNSIKESEPVSSLAWRPSDSNRELFISSFHLVKPGKIMKVEFSDSNMNIISNNLPKHTNFMWMTWNNTGQILAGSAFKGFDHFLGLYYYESNKFIVTNVPSSKNIVWEDDESLYVYNEGKISKISIVDSNCQTVESFFILGDVFLIGMLDGKLAYRSDNKIFLGDKILYEANSKIGAVVIDYHNIAFQTKTKSSRKVMVINNKGSIINEKNVKEDSMLIGFINDFIYLREDQKYIKKYNLNDNTKMSTVFSVNDI